MLKTTDLFNNKAFLASGTQTCFILAPVHSNPVKSENYLTTFLSSSFVKQPLPHDIIQIITVK